VPAVEERGDLRVGAQGHRDVAWSYTAAACWAAAGRKSPVACDRAR